MARRRATIQQDAIPAFTDSLDTKIPSENVVFSYYMSELSKWYVASQASDGRVFTSFARTETLARRAAGLRTLNYLRRRAEGVFPELTPDEIEMARSELMAALNDVVQMVVQSNSAFPETYSRDVVLAELRAAKQLLDVDAARGALARWVAPPLMFLAGAFAEGLIGVGAERALELLEKLLSG